MRAVFIVVAALGMLVGCATMKQEAPGLLRIECNVADAAVVIDDAVVGRASEVGKPGKSLAPGFYRVELRHPGYYSHFVEVTVPEEGVATVKAELHPQLD
jgi:hypothetical protein